MDPQQILRILRQRGWKVICWGAAIGVLVGAASYYLQTAKYQASSQVLVQQSGASQFVAQPTTQIDPATFLATQVVVMRSLAVAQAAAATLPGHPSPDVLLNEISVVSSPTGVLTVTATSSDPAHAQATANAFAKAFVANRHTYSVGSMQAAVDEISPQLDAMQRQIAALDTRITSATAVKPDAVSVGLLQARRDAVRSQYSTLFSSQEQLRVQIQLTHDQAELVTDAGLPGTPTSPKPLRDAALGALAGLLIGVGVEVLREKFDDKIDTAEEVEEIIAHPLLAQIPKDDAVALTASPVVVRPGEFSEAIRALRTGLQFLGGDEPLRRIVVSSAGTGDGKTTVAAHLAVAYAEAGFVTVLISGDLRRPQVESLFGSTNTDGLGLSSLLATGPLRPRSAANAEGNGHGQFTRNGNGNGNGSHPAQSESSSERSVRLMEFLRLLAMSTGIDNLTVIPAGPTPPNPAELLGSTRMRETLDALGQHADVIIIDTPPALVVTDSVVLAAASDGVVLVMSAAKSTRRDLKRLMATYEAADVPVLGAVLNRARSRGGSEYYNVYKAPSQPEVPSRWARRKEPKASV